MSDRLEMLAHHQVFKSIFYFNKRSEILQKFLNFWEAILATYRLTLGKFLNLKA